MSKTTHRAPGQTQFTFQLPIKLKQRLKVAASAENRSLGNFVVLALERYLERSYPDLLAAEDPDAYGASLPTPVLRKRAQSERKAE